MNNSNGGGGLGLIMPINLTQPLECIAQKSETPAEVDGPGASISFAQTVSGTGGFMKMGEGTASFAHANTYTGGTQVRGGMLDANVAGSLSTGTVLMNDGSSITTRTMPAPAPASSSRR
jgi:autotransporter-associated beta strand protein